MAFGVDVQVGDQRAVIEIPRTGLSRKQKTVNLENFRLELADPADSDKLVIAMHEDGTTSKFTAQAVDGWEFPVTDPVTTSLGVSVKAKADGRPGEGEKDIEDDGIIVLKAPDAASFGSAVVATPEDLA